MKDKPAATDRRYTEAKLRHCAETLDELMLRSIDYGLTAEEVTELGRARDFVATTANTLRNARQGRPDPALERRRETATKNRKRKARKRARDTRKQNR
jgi:hypothetical protein